MIPYIHLESIHLTDTIALQPFGLLVGAGVLLGARMARLRARQAGVEESEIRDAIFWAVVPGFWMAHWVELIFYHPEWFDTKGPWVFFKFWDGISSFGGFLGGFLGQWFYFARKRKPWLTQAEIIVEGLVVGMILGRLGCAVVHDHPGSHSDFFLAVQYPGGSRHDLGFYEFLWLLLVVFPATLWIRARGMAVGTVLSAILLLYAPFRFVCDFIRVDVGHDADKRYLGLTPAQYGCLALFVAAGLLLARLRAGAGVAAAAPAGQKAKAPGGRGARA